MALFDQKRWSAIRTEMMNRWYSVNDVDAWYSAYKSWGDEWFRSFIQKLPKPNQTLAQKPWDIKPVSTKPPAPAPVIPLPVQPWAKITKDNFDPKILTPDQQRQVAAVLNSWAPNAKVNAQNLALSFANSKSSTGTSVWMNVNYDSSTNRESEISSNLSKITSSDTNLLKDRNAFNQKFWYATADAGKKKILDDYFSKNGIPNPANAAASSVPSTAQSTWSNSPTPREQEISSNVSNISASSQDVLSDRKKFDEKFGYATADESKKKILDDFYSQYHNLFGNITTPANPWSSQVNDTIGAMTAAQQDYARKNAEMQRAYWKEAGDIVSGYNKEFIDASNQRQADLESTREKYFQDVEESNKRADDILKVQHDIAARQANIAAANAGQSWLQLSASDMEWIKSDAISRFGSNISTAMDYANKTKTQNAKDRVTVAKEIWVALNDMDKFEQLMVSQNNQPMLNAISKAAEGDKEALKFVADKIAEVQAKQLDEETGRYLKRERIEANQREYWTAPEQTKISLVRENIASADYWVWPEAAAMLSDSELTAIIRRHPWNFMDAVAEAAQEAIKRKYQAATAQLGWQSTPNAVSTVWEIISGKWSSAWSSSAWSGVTTSVAKWGKKNNNSWINPKSDTSAKVTPEWVKDFPDGTKLEYDGKWNYRYTGKDWRRSSWTKEWTNPIFITSKSKWIMKNADWKIVIPNPPENKTSVADINKKIFWNDFQNKAILPSISENQFRDFIKTYGKSNVEMALRDVWQIITTPDLDFYKSILDEYA